MPTLARASPEVIVWMLSEAKSKNCWVMARILGSRFQALSGSMSSESWLVMRPSTDMMRNRVVSGRSLSFMSAIWGYYSLRIRDWVGGRRERGRD